MSVLKTSTRASKTGIKDTYSGLALARRAPTNYTLTNPQVPSLQPSTHMMLSGRTQKANSTKPNIPWPEL